MPMHEPTKPAPACVRLQETRHRQDEELTWRTRSTAWELAALSFSYPSEALCRAVSSGEWAEAAVEVASALGFSLPEGFETACACGSSATPEPEHALHVLRIEATRLFVGAPEPAISPYEGVWRSAADGAPALLFVNPYSTEVERFCRSCGLGRAEGTNEPLDHLATECELLEHLALRSLGLAMDEESPLPADADLPGGSPQAAYEAFLVEHVGTWAPGFAAAVSTETRLPFYRDATELLKALIG